MHPKRIRTCVLFGVAVTAKQLALIEFFFHFVEVIESDPADFEFLVGSASVMKVEAGKALVVPTGLALAAEILDAPSLEFVSAKVLPVRKALSATSLVDRASGSVRLRPAPLEFIEREVTAAAGASFLAVRAFVFEGAIVAGSEWRAVVAVPSLPEDSMLSAIPGHELWDLAPALQAAAHAIILPDIRLYGQAMAIGVVPTPRNRVRRHLSRLPLLK